MLKLTSVDNVLILNPSVDVDAIRLLNPNGGKTRFPRKGTQILEQKNVRI